MDAPAPLFRALAMSTRPIYQLLRCVSFSNKVHVEISEDGIKFIADHTRVMQGMASLSKSMFAAYALNPPRGATIGNRANNVEEEAGEEDDALPVSFQISLPALLEALQIFGVTDAPLSRPIKPDPDAYRSMRSGTAAATNSSYSNYNRQQPQQQQQMQGTDAFSHQILGMPGTCSLTYVEEGAPFGIVLEEAAVKTTCNLATYVPEALEPIPFDRDNLQFKMIMQPRWLLDALVELAPASPNLLTLSVVPNAPYLRLASQGPLGSSSVDFSRGRGLFESLWVGARWTQSFKFDLIKAATEAMRLASKVSIRGDRQGVLSLQFMVEMENAGFGSGLGGAGAAGGAGGASSGSGGMQWLHFTFVPFMTDEEEEDDDDEGEEEPAGDTGRGAKNGGAGDAEEDDDDEL
ncbi:DNA repair protein [Niveomyces insectorum RCEF 264]|uniref:DNA repair protein n=1 Tax=Niveomyces insectorum RCEF 264 TaxID=1081102 RepID=A0A162J4S1_9HYPO|nr:DNA repair protein [Niveomyces insectorum RCEF 264]